MDFAYSRLGCPYVWGANGPNEFDCLGLTRWCFAQTGIYIGDNQYIYAPSEVYRLSAAG